MEEIKSFDRMKGFGLSKSALVINIQARTIIILKARAQQTKLLQQPFKVSVELNKYPGEKST
jgi:hypothetical protein